MKKLNKTPFQAAKSNRKWAVIALPSNVTVVVAKTRALANELAKMLNTVTEEWYEMSDNS